MFLLYIVNIYIYVEKICRRYIHIRRENILFYYFISYIYTYAQRKYIVFTLYRKNIHIRRENI